MRIRFLILIAAPLALGAGLILFYPAFAQPQALQSNPLALALMDEVNALRGANALPPYQVSPKLMRVAQLHAEHISATGYLSHYERSLAPYQRAIEGGYAVAGNLNWGGLFAENLFSGSSPSAADVVKAWQADNQFTEALLSPELEDAGVGVALGADGLTYFVLDVGAELDDPTLLFSATPTVTVPFAASTPLEDGAIHHIVKVNEALSIIAQEYGVTVADLKKLNRLSSDEIYEGQELTIYIPPVEESWTSTPTVTPTATFGIPTSTATQPVAPTETFTPTPRPVAPISTQTSGAVVLIIVLLALLGAGAIAFLAGRKNNV